MQTAIMLMIGLSLFALGYRALKLHDMDFFRALSGIALLSAGSAFSDPGLDVIFKFITGN